MILICKDLSNFWAFLSKKNWNQKIILELWLIRHILSNRLSDFFLSVSSIQNLSISYFSPSVFYIKTGQFPASFTLFSSFLYSWLQTNVLHKSLLITGFKPWTSSVGSDCSTNRATTTALYPSLAELLLLCKIASARDDGQWRRRKNWCILLQTFPYSFRASQCRKEFCKLFCITPVCCWLG